MSIPMLRLDLAIFGLLTTLSQDMSDNMLFDVRLIIGHQPDDPVCNLGTINDAIPTASSSARRAPTEFATPQEPGTISPISVLLISTLCSLRYSFSAIYF